MNAFLKREIWQKKESPLGCMYKIKGRSTEAVTAHAEQTEGLRTDAHIIESHWLHLQKERQAAGRSTGPGATYAEQIESHNFTVNTL
jgi:hypothetical protein